MNFVNYLSDFKVKIITDVIQLSNSNRYNFTMTVLNKDGSGNSIGGYYTITPDNIPSPNNS